MTNKTIEYNDGIIIWNLPLTTTKGKVRIKDENYMGIGKRVGTIFKNGMKIECQIGYDCPIKASDKKQQQKIANKLETVNECFRKMEFVASNGNTKVPYELSEILGFAYHNFKSAVSLIDELVEQVNAIKITFEEWEEAKPFLSTERTDTFNGKKYIDRPKCNHNFEFVLSSDITISVIPEERQYADGIQPMLYVYLNSPNSLVGKKIVSNQVYQHVITEKDIDVFCEIMLHLAMLTPRHKKDVLTLLDIIRKNSIS